MNKLLLIVCLLFTTNVFADGYAGCEYFHDLIGKVAKTRLAGVHLYDTQMEVILALKKDKLTPAQIELAVRVVDEIYAIEGDYVPKDVAFAYYEGCILPRFGKSEAKDCKLAYDIKKMTLAGVHREMETEADMMGSLDKYRTNMWVDHDNLDRIKLNMAYVFDKLTTIPVTLAVNIITAARDHCLEKINK